MEMQFYQLHDGFEAIMQRRAVEAAGLPLVAIIGIAIGGSFIVFGVLTLIAISQARRRHRHELRKKAAAEEVGMFDIKERGASSTWTPEFSPSRRLTFNPFLPLDIDSLDDEHVQSDWTGEHVLPSRAKPKRLSPQRLFKISGMRDSWPLVSTIPMRLLPGSSSTVTLSNVAAPGYELPPEPKRPKKAASRLSKTIDSVPRERLQLSMSETRGSSWQPPRQGPNHRPISETHLSSILRSTSERLKPANRHPLTRTLTTRSQAPGPPPLERLPNPPKRRQSQSRILRSTSERLKSANRQSITRTLTTRSQAPGPPPWERLPSPPKRQPTESRIFRPSSQRSEFSNKHSLNRKLTKRTQETGSPPQKRFPKYSKGRATESREALIESDDSEYEESVASFVYNAFVVSSISPQQAVQRTPPSQRAKSPAPSSVSDDSLCEVMGPDLADPKTLSTPSRKGIHSDIRTKMQLSAEGPNFHSRLISMDNQGSNTKVCGSARGPRRLLSLTQPHRPSSPDDTFSLDANSAKINVTKNQPHVPRPLYIRKATFGQAVGPERSKSLASPLKSISGNVQTPSKKSTSVHFSSLQPDISNTRSEPNQPNPFQWMPQEVTQTHSARSSPSTKRRNGHRRSSLVRISNLPRPSSVAMVAEEPEKTVSILKNSVPSSGSARVLETNKNPSTTPQKIYGQKLGNRPPSAAMFNPSIPSVASRSADNSPTLGTGEFMRMYSPTLSVSNYYTDNSETSEDEFFDRKKSVTSISHQNRDLFKETFTLGCEKSHPCEKLPGNLFSFPPPSISPRNTDANKKDSQDFSPHFVPSRPLPSTSGIPPVPQRLDSKITAPALPLLAMPIPGHLTGPREDPSKRANTYSSPRDSLRASIGILRRMNSEVSDCSSFSPVSPTRSGSRHEAQDKPEERGSSRGSKHYLSIGLDQHANQSRDRDQAPIRPTDRRNSHRSFQNRRKRHNDDLDNDAVRLGLTPVKEASSPLAVTSGNLKESNSESTLRKFSSRKHETGNYHDLSPSWSDGQLAKRMTQSKGKAFGEYEIPKATRSKDRQEHRWSQAMSQPAITAARRESKIQHPCPVTPPKWGWATPGSLGFAAHRLQQQENKSNLKPGNEIIKGFAGGMSGNGRGRPNSFGLYDQDGFLRPTPDRDWEPSGKSGT